GLSGPPSSIKISGRSHWRSSVNRGSTVMRYFSLKPPAASSSFSMSLILWAAATLSARGIGEKSNLQLYQKIEKYEVRRTRKYEVRSAKYEVKITTNLLPYFVLRTSSFLLSLVRMSFHDV